MSRRIWLVVAAVMVGSLVLGVSISAAKGHKKHHAAKPPAPKPTTVSTTCKLALTVAIAPGDTVVDADEQSGTMYGTASCSGVGKGIASFPFVVADSGDTVGTLAIYTANGSVSGKVDLTESDSQPPTPYDFGNADFTGTFKITGGTGAYSGVTGKGTFPACSTLDAIHYACTLKASATLPAAA